MVDIPPEIWLHILQFLPKEELYRLISVNRLFLEVGMNSKWESVELSNKVLDSHLPSTMQTLKRLSDPFVASKLKILNIEITVTYNDTTDVTDIDNPTELIKFPTFDELINGIVQAAPHFKNVTNVDLTCWNLSPSCNPEILRSIWFPMSQSLKVLSLAGSLGAFRVLIESLPPMPQLDELRLLFMEDYTLDEGGQLAVLITHVVPFINSIGPRLKLLSIYSWTNVDLSVVFKNLHTPPALRELAISFFFNVSLAEPPQLNRFLKRCSDTVVNLGLSLQVDWDTSDVSGQRRDEWLMDLFSADNQCLMNLEDLNISLRTVKDHAVDILAACLQKTQKTLQELCVRDRYLNSGEFSRVLDAAANCMQLNCLWINIDRVDWDVIEMLAPKLPRIRRLFIVTPALAILSSERGPDEMSTHYPTATAQLLEHRVCKHLQWKLHVAELWEDGGGRLKIENMLTTA
ncbi:hypothetical protein CPC08DRAFT_706135 [Agrocybe pediades]|nr:hypothetical protein CPC08DRAFT_706135 [Agrocybe pediades]